MKFTTTLLPVRALILLVASIVPICRGQSVKPTSIGGLPVPSQTGILGKQDASALEELKAHFEAVGQTRWVGMQARGAITFSAQGSSSYAATLSNLGIDMFRLDVQEQSGPTSTRIHGPLGKVQGSNGVVTAMPPSAALAGIFPFERLRTSGAPSRNVSLIDHGVVAIAGASLRRLTAESATPDFNPATRSHATIATDLYFDPATHLLVKSATSEPAASGRQANFLVVITYEDYRSVGTSLIPFRYTKTVEGQPYSILQLSTVQLAPALTASDFEF